MTETPRIIALVCAAAYLSLIGCSDDGASRQDVASDVGDALDTTTADDAGIGGDTGTTDTPITDTGTVDAATTDTETRVPRSDVELDAATTCVPLVVPETVGVHVAPDGRPDASGTMADPIDLVTALSSDGPALPGDTIWLASGTYAGVYTSELRGTEAFPIVVRPLPGARVTLDSNVTSDEGGSGLTINGEWSVFMGLEVMSSDPGRVSTEDSSNPSDITLRSGINVFGPNTAVVNCVVHDTAGGFGSWRPAVDSVLYGNVIYNNGWTAPGKRAWPRDLHSKRDWHEADGRQHHLLRLWHRDPRVHRGRRDRRVRCAPQRLVPHRRIGSTVLAAQGRLPDRRVSAGVTSDDEQQPELVSVPWNAVGLWG